MKRSHHNPFAGGSLLSPYCQGPQPVGIVCGFDRITVALDRSALPGPVDRVTAACGGGMQFVPGYMDFNPMFQSQIGLLQPTQTAIDVLIKDCLGHTVTALLTYAEVACDFIFERRSQARAFQYWLAELMVMRHQRDLVYRYKRIYYFSRRTDPDGTKRGRVGALYADRPSKLNGEFAGRPCVHVSTPIEI